MRLPVDVQDLLRTGSQLLKARDAAVRILFVVENDASDELLDAVETSFRPRTASATIDVKMTSEVIPGAPAVVPDVAVVLLGSGAAGARDSVEALRTAAVPVCGVTLASDPGAVALAAGLPDEDVFAGESATIMSGPLAAWIVARTPDSRLALAHNFPILRRAIADQAVTATAWQNALIGVVAIVPGADMPIMTANQAKMLLQIAAAYGEPLGAERIAELATVVGGGFLFRTIAREALALVPGFGWALKGAIAYTGTIAMGKAATEYFEDDADVFQVVARLQMKAGEIGREAARMAPGAGRRAALGAGARRSAPGLPLGARRRASAQLAADDADAALPEAGADAVDAGA